MAIARLLILVVLGGGLDVAAAAGDPCAHERERMGLAVVASEGTLRVSGVDPGSYGATAGARVGDEVLQVNDVVPAGCRDWLRAVRAAREGRKAVLMLVRRGDVDVPLAVSPAAWHEAPVAAPDAVAVPTPSPAAPAPGSGVAPTIPAAPVAPAPRPGAKPAPPVRPGHPVVEATPPPPPLPDDVPLSVEGVVADLRTLGTEAPSATSLAGYRKDVRKVRRAIETLAARRGASEEMLGRLRRIVRHYEAAEIAWESEQALRERDGRRSNVPIADEAPAPFFDDSTIGGVLAEFPFLRETVTKEPSGEGLFLSSGTWQPVRARKLLWERAASAVEELGR